MKYPQVWMTIFCLLDRKNIHCESWKSQHEYCNPQAVINSSSRLENHRSSPDWGLTSTRRHGCCLNATPLWQKDRFFDEHWHSVLVPLNAPIIKTSDNLKTSTWHWSKHTSISFIHDDGWAQMSFSFSLAGNQIRFFCRRVPCYLPAAEYSHYRILFLTTDYARVFVTHLGLQHTWAEVSLAEHQTRRSPDLLVTVVQREHPHTLTVGLKV